MVVIVPVVLEDHVRQLQPAAVLNRRSLGLAPCVEPFGIGEAVVLAPVGMRARVNIENRVDDAADVSRHPRRAQCRGVGNGAAIVGPDIEQPLRFRHVTIAASDLACFADRAELAFGGCSCLDRTRKPRLEEELLAQQSGRCRIAVLVGCIHRQVRQRRQRVNHRPFERRKSAALRRGGLAAKADSHPGEHCPNKS